MDNTPAHGKRLWSADQGMVLLGRIELPTSPLPRVRSTTELQQQDHEEAGREVNPPGRRAPLAFGSPLVKRERGRQAGSMSEDKREPTREERLAAKLRENLRRRKAQAREMDERDDSLPKAPERG